MTAPITWTGHPARGVARQLTVTWTLHEAANGHGVERGTGRI